jgi:peptidyl-prolyl cis-trans isomerase B (cyclophilin B)
MTSSMNKIHMKKIFAILLLISVSFGSFAQKDSTIKKKDRKRDVLIQTNYGDMVLRLSDSTPLHRDNFIKLVKVGFYDSVLFHRVIQGFMIQGGDPLSRGAVAGIPLGSGGPGYRVPAEFRTTLFHKKGALAAARDNNPEKASSGSQFYISQGKVYTNAGLDSLEQFRMVGRKFTPEERAAYTTVGGVPFLDQNYTVFGELVKGFDVLDKIAATPTSKASDRDRPLEDVKVIKAKLVKRRK